MSDQTPNVVVTNDDGIDSPGMRLLADALSDRFDVVVAAPASDMSGRGPESADSRLTRVWKWKR